jgi:replicative superfamily II helicase
MLAESAHDPALKHTLPFGIGIHHAGLDESDRHVVEELFGSGKLQVCSTCAMLNLHKLYTQSAQSSSVE